uniref:Vitelline membrane outer layer 1 homolog n=1 Tax=Anolis carolinensis TaxID=28377 RepID=A0A803THD4_ANOCA
MTIIIFVDRWGSWRKPEYCPKGHLTSFSLQVEPSQGAVIDDTAANNVKFVCNEGFVLTGEAHDWGNFGFWSEPCSSGHLTSFSLQVEPSQGAIYDDTAANNIKFVCNEGFVLTGEAHDWGKFGFWSEPCSSGAICGLQTKIEDSQGSGDDTALNDVRFFCCK